jgi:choline dehydrogenase-like flavoprotein
MTEEFDYIIIGAGSAGCVLAHRLGSNPAIRILVLEAGPKDWHPLLQIPLGIGRIHPGRLYDWGYDNEPEASVHGRRIDALRGRVVGGSSSINSMLYVRGNQADYDRWVAKGAKGWGYSEVLPHFKAIEEWEDAAQTEYRGNAGNIKVTAMRDPDPLYKAWVAAIVEAGYSSVPDYNAAVQEGFSQGQFSIGNGHRSSASVAFLRPALKRGNVELRTNALAGRILFDGRRATGIEYTRGQQTFRATARREVILAAGAFNSPHLLMLSGIGPAADLASRGIDVRLDAPGVGANLQDHCCALVSFARKTRGHFLPTMRFDRMACAMVQAYLLGTGAATVMPVGLVGFIRSRPELTAPDLQFVLRGVLPSAQMWFPGIKRPSQDGFGARSVLLHPESRGRLELASADPRDRIRIFQNFFGKEQDLIGLRNSVRIIRDFTLRGPMAPYCGEELDPGVSLQRDDEIDDWIRQTMTTAYHPVGTCAMGDGPMAVLDPALRVRGFDGLRVVDASAMPDLPSGNTNAPTMMMASKAADMISSGR